MSYISAIRINDEVIVWERSAEGRTSKRFRAPYYFYVKSKTGTHETIYGDHVKRYDFSNSREYQRAREDMRSSGIRMFESDIPPEIKVLSQHYYNVPAPTLNISFYDIEVDYDPVNGFSSVANPYAPINSVAIYHQWKKEYVIICVPPTTESYTPTDQVPKAFIDKMNAVAPLPENVRVIFAADEKELLMWFLAEVEDSDVLCGWNSDLFDMPYIGKRLEKLGKKFFRMLSFDEAQAPVFVEVDPFKNGQMMTSIELSGRISADYMRLFRKYEQAERPSYKLESIADEIVPELPKLTYEGSLHELYRRDFAYFVRYNLRDTEVLGGFERKLGYVDLANQMYHMSTGVFKHVTGTIKLSELAVVNYCHHVLGDLIVNDFAQPGVDRQIKGALVLLPQVGEHKYVGSIDVKSLYPSSILSLNISPETLRGQFEKEIYAFEQIGEGTNETLVLQLETGETEQHTAHEWRTILWERKWAISGFGTVFDQSKMGIIPSILAEWFQMRLKYQKLMKEAKEKGDKDKADYYDRLQYVFKIKLNSFYGALSNLYFRFYDLRMGESTTGTGRVVVRHQCRKVNEILCGDYDVDFPQYETVAEAIEHKADPKTALYGPLFNGQFQSETVVYGDTDSTYFETFTENKDQALKIANFVGKQVNGSYAQFMRKAFLCQPGFDNRISCSREIVTGRGIFVDKKRYILHVIDQDDKPVDKMKVMGLDTKKTTLPKHVATKLNNFVERYLKGEQWDSLAHDIVTYKEELKNTSDIMAIGLPKGIQKVEEYTKEFEALGDGTRLPGHVAAAIFYNKCLAEFGDKESMPIKTGMKIKVFYLNQKFGKFKSIAIPVDIEELPKWFPEKFIVNREAHIERLVDNPLQNILNAINKEVPSQQSLLTDSILEF